MDTERQLQLDQFDAEAFTEAARDYAEAKAAKDSYAEKEKLAVADLSQHVPSRDQTDFDVAWGFTGKVGDQTYDVSVTRPSAVEWDQDALAQVMSEAEAQGLDVSHIVKVEYKVDAKALKKAGVEQKSLVHKARVVTPYLKSGELRAPKVSVKLSD